MYNGTSFAKNYDSMFSGFESNGLVLNQNYFVYNYDWRKPLANQIADFNLYVNNLGLISGEKVDIVGHSFGGLIGRIWTQENPDKVNKIITLASPNFGAVNVYEMWNGAKISNPTDHSSIALNILLALQRGRYQTAVETIRNFAPSLNDLLPTFDYLKKNEVIISPPQNNYLNNKNLTVSSIYDKFLAVTGLGFETKEWINLTDRTIFDSVLGQWSQGRPISYVETDGDGTVLKKSASFMDDGGVNVVANHGEVPNKSVNLVLAQLGLGKTITEITLPSFNGAVFYIGSPASMLVNCGDNDLTDTDGFILVANKNISDCVVKLTGVSNGIYHLVMGNSADDESWKYTEGNISIGETKNISVNLIDYWYEQMLRETNILLTEFPININLKNMKKAIIAKNRLNLIDSYMLFRKQKLETIITWQMINYLEMIINIEVSNPNYGISNSQKTLALVSKSFVNKKVLNPTVWQSLNYIQGEELLSTPNYGRYLLADKIFDMMWH